MKKSFSKFLYPNHFIEAIQTIGANLKMAQRADIDFNSKRTFNGNFVNIPFICKILKNIFTIYLPKKRIRIDYTKS